MNKKNNPCDHIGIFTKDAERVIKFYKTILGFKLVSSERLQSDIVKEIFKINSSCCFYRLKFEEFILEIFEPHKKTKVDKKGNLFGIHHFGFKVIDRERFIGYLKKKRIKVITIKRDNHKVYFIKDPDGNMIEIRKAE